MAVTIALFKCRSDNFGYLVHDEATGRTASIDAPEAEVILAELNARGWTLSDILVTHHHADHVEDIPKLVAATGAKVTGPAAEADKIGSLDVTVAPGDHAMVGETRFEVLNVAGHTLGHIAWFDPEGHHLFCGDALFSLGCGRMFEGTPGPMWAHLSALRELPGDTLIYCGHEYTQSNARFALSVDPANKALKARADEVDRLRAEGKFTIPARLSEEMAANPFLRADNRDLAVAMGMADAAPANVFAALRSAKDHF